MKSEAPNSVSEEMQLRQSPSSQLSELDRAKVMLNLEKMRRLRAEFEAQSLKLLLESKNIEPSKTPSPLKEQFNEAAPKPSAYEKNIENLKKVGVRLGNSAQREWRKSMVEQNRANEAEDKLGITEEKLKKAQLNPLTGLPNREIMDDDLARVCAQIDRGHHDNYPEGTPMASYSLVIVDVGGLKAVNEGRKLAKEEGLEIEGFNLNYKAGDTLLKTTGSALKSFIRGEDRAYHFGGDEFALLIRNNTMDPKEHDQMMDRLQKHLKNQRFEHDGYSYPTRFYTVASQISEEGETPEKVFEETTDKLDDAKDKGGSDRKAIGFLIEGRKKLAPEVEQDVNLGHEVPSEPSAE